ncbi:cytochrome d ubiquinol oxidase subunit II [Chlamydiifrater phoenicopteri]|uniref:cytochrome d ubiquinol oxidase subunit II n=1 Tax=Chlamydiifrater phoenicopteri TaxID=2681469 RepID=UPI001BCDB70C|nr:cytochrome d ubiquinol oxidase subunit II [Chlamydiifrater phoenicopteri]
MLSTFSSGVFSSLFSENTLAVLWYVILAVAVFAYSLGEGFDLGVSSIYFLSKTEEDRRKLLNSIGPVWDGNEVWLIIVIAGMFAGFPSAYALLLSIFYMPMWSFVTMLILRGVSLEFRSKSESKRWKKFWDCSFAFSGSLIAFFLGAFLGNLLMGLPIAPDISYAEISWSLFFRPYAVLCGLLVVSAYSIHGACFSLIKVDGELEQRISQKMSQLVSIFLVLQLTVVVVTTLKLKELLFGAGYPVMIGCVLASCLALVASVKKVRIAKYRQAFFFSVCNLVCLVVSSSVMLFPNLLRSLVSPEHSLTVYNSAVEAKTLKVLLLIVLIGLPFVIAYAVYIYRVFRGKTDFKSIY